MIIASRRLSTWAAAILFSSLAAAASAQATPETPLQKQLSRLDLNIGAIGMFTKDTSGPDGLTGAALTDSPGNTVGLLATIRYIKSPLIGIEFNGTYSRFVQTYSGPYISTFPASPLGVQADASEYSLGWVFHGPLVYNFSTFASVGAGTTDFTPTRGGGQGFLPQARATYYYNVGLERPVTEHIGLRVSFRQAFYLAPDFETNYIRNLQHTYSTEPAVGFVLHY